MRTDLAAAHHRAIDGPAPPAVGGMEDQLVEMAVGVALVVISALLIWGIIRTVGNNSPMR